MTRKVLFLLFFMLMKMNASPQEITRRDADSIINALNEAKPGVKRIDLLLNLAQFHIFKPGERAIDFDSAMIYINEASTLNKSVKSSEAHGYELLTLSYLIKEKGQKEEGRKMAEKAVRTLESGSNKYYLGRAYYELSMYYDYEEFQQRIQKITLVEKSVQAFQQAGNLERKAASLTMLGDLYGMMAEYPKSIEVLKHALAIYDTIKYEKLQGVYIALGETYQYQGDESQALYYMLKALKTAHMVQDTSMQLCRINNIIGTLYLRVDRKEMSVKYLNDALEIARKYKDELAIFLLATNISVTYNNLGQPDQALKVLATIPESFLKTDYTSDRASIGMAYLRTYTALKQYSNAQSYCDAVLELANNNKVVGQTRNSIYRLAATYYFYTKQYSKARYYLTKNIEIAQKAKYENGIIQDARLWYKLDSAEGNFESAFRYLHFFKTKTDSVFSENRVKQLQVLGVEYETAMKEDSIKKKNEDIVLLMQRNHLQQTHLKEARLIRNLTIIGIFLALIIIILLYRLYRHKQKNNEVITQKNAQLEHYLSEKEWLLKEIHHRVKNNLQIVMSLLNSQSVYIDNEHALTAIHDSQHRVHAMSLIHQKLYNSENLSSIEMSFYIRELVSYLANSFDTGQRIRFEFAIEPLEMDVSQAVPLGLILNEAITNAIKYAFPDDRSGVIAISLSSTSPHHYLLSISDNGIGMPSHFIRKKAGSLGMSLLAGLSEDLDGSFSIENNNGTIIKIVFVHDPGIRRPDIMVAAFALNN